MKPADRPPLLKNETLLQQGRYKIDSFLGQGGAGQVYRVTQESLDIPRALKLLAPEHPEEESEYRSTFESEVNNLLKLTHRNIIKILDYDHDGIENYPFYIMEYAEGPVKEIASHRIDSREKLFDLLDQLFAGIIYAHYLCTFSVSPVVATAVSVQVFQW